jgi:hypothetical protein
MIRPPKDHYLRSSPDRPALRIGLLVDSMQEVPAFAAKIISDIKGSDFSTIELVIAMRSAGRDSQERRDLLYELYLRLDARMKPANDPLSKVDGAELLTGVPILEVNSDCQLSAEALAAISSKKLDVLLNFGSKSLSSDILSAAQYGVWSLHHGDTEFERSSPALFWEMREQSPVTGVNLQVLSKEVGQEIVLGRVLFATEQTISVSRNRYIPYWGSTDLIIQKLHELHEFGWDHVRGRALSPAPYTRRARSP